MGGKLTFNGGIHPYDGKDLSKDKPIRDILPKGDLVYPLSQHIGAPAKPVVKKGDHVLTGQLIAEAGGFVSAPVYATVSGTVKAIEPHRTVVGRGSQGHSGAGGQSAEASGKLRRTVWQM